MYYVHMRSREIRRFVSFRRADLYILNATGRRRRHALPLFWFYRLAKNHNYKSSPRSNECLRARQTRRRLRH